MTSPAGDNPTHRIGAGDTQWVATQEALQRAARAWQQCTWLGVDTEFVRERTYHARLGLVQVGDGNRIWLVDPLAVSSLEPLAKVLAVPSITKIFHSAREDLEVLYHHTGARTWPLFDTQRAAALSGFPLQCAYHNLVGELLDVTIAKGTARTNWLARPLSHEQLEYAAADVRYLPQMARELRAQLTQQRRDEWLHEDLEQLARQASQTPDPQTQYRRIRGAAELCEAALARLRTLAAWRESTARERDLPRGFLLHDDELLALAAQNPADGGAVRALVSPRSSAYRRDADRIAQILANPGRPPQPVAGPLDAEQRQRVKRMQHRIRACAERLGIDPAVLASRRDLERLVRESSVKTDKPALPGWRGRLLEAEHAATSAGSEPS